MRLLHYNDDGEFSLTQFFDKIPQYAILSHTWGPEEVTFKDMVDGNGASKTGFEKIRFCGEQARRDRLQYFWVDTCCIDKSSSAELTEAINSMFHWYREAARCYVYLSDVSITGCEQNNEQLRAQWELSFRTSKWFTRGWTLQELLAPASVEFFMREGQRIGDKNSLELDIQEITGIALSALRGRDLSQFDIDERFKWAKTRTTTREEDWAYCLLGIFGVNMPLIYGERKAHAVRRLRWEIDKAPYREAPTCSGGSSSAPSDLRFTSNLSYTNLIGMLMAVKTVQVAYMTQKGITRNIPIQVWGQWKPSLNDITFRTTLGTA
jgi:hypothetical protein